MILKIEQRSFREIEGSFKSLEDVSAFISAYGEAFTKADKSTKFIVTSGGVIYESRGKISTDTTELESTEKSV